MYSHPLFNGCPNASASLKIGAVSARRKLSFSPPLYEAESCTSDASIASSVAAPLRGFAPPFSALSLADGDGASVRSLSPRASMLNFPFRTEPRHESTRAAGNPGTRSVPVLLSIVPSSQRKGQPLALSFPLICSFSEISSATSGWNARYHASKSSPCTATL